MAQNVVINGVTYQSVPEVNIPKSGGGTAKFYDTADGHHHGSRRADRDARVRFERRRRWIHGEQWLDQRHHFDQGRHRHDPERLHVRRHRQHFVHGTVQAHRVQYQERRDSSGRFRIPGASVHLAGQHYEGSFDFVSEVASNGSKHNAYGGIVFCRSRSSSA